MTELALNLIVIGGGYVIVVALATLAVVRLLALLRRKLGV